MKKNCSSGCHVVPFRWKLLLRMKLIVTLICIVGLTASFGSVYSQQTKLNLNVQNMTVKDVLKLIEDQSSYTFMYNASKINVYREVNIKTENSSVENILKKLFAGENISYRIIDRNIIISSDSEIFDSNQPTQNVSGKVTDGSGQPLPGVTVIIKGSTTGVITDVDGAFNLSNVQVGAIIQLSFVGMKTQEIKLTGNSLLKVVMEEESIGLDEVVAVGYGTSKRRDLIGSVAKIDNEKIANIRVTSVAESMQGMASGLMVSSSAGNPGAPPKIKIRGINSINLSTDPLWIVDGVPIQSGSVGSTSGDGATPISAIAMINPNDIESVEVLKDASATAIYGSRASSGVILVTTKSNKGKLTGLSVNYDGGASQLAISQKDYFADSKTWWAIMAKACTNSTPPATLLTPEFIMSTQFMGDKPAMTREEAMATNTDALDAMTQIGLSHQIGLTFNKGFDTGGMMFTTNYRKEEGVLRNNNFERLTTRYNINFKPISPVEVGLNTNLMYINSDGVSSPGGVTKGNGGFGNLLASLPWFKIYDPNSPTGYWAATSGFNPLAFSDPQYYINNVKEYRTISNAYLQWTTPVKGLTARADVGIDLAILKNSYWRSGLLNPAKNENSASELSSYSTRTNWDAYVTYDKKIGQHNINGTIGFEANKYWSYRQYMKAAQVQTIYPELINPLQMKEMNGRQDGEGFMLGYFARANYKFKDRYILNASVRRDGISALSNDNRWATFYAFGGGWIISDESFLKSIEQISLLKLRASYGTTGNTNISNSMTYTVWGLNATRIYGTSTIPGATTVGPIGSNNLKWETSKNMDIGLDYGLFDNRINGSFAIYEQKTSDLILKTELAPSVGYSSNQLYENVGDMKNWGVEFSITSVNVNKKNFSWKTDFNISTNKNRIVRLNATEKGKGNISGVYIRKEGESLNTYYLANYVNVDPQKGIFMMEERDQTKWNTEYVTASTGNTIPMNDTNIPNNQMIQSGKTSLPTFYGGFGNTFTYKNFDLNIQLNFAGGNWLINDVAQGSSRLLGVQNLDKDIESKSWQKPGDIKDYPAMTYFNLYNYDNAGNPITGTTKFGDNYGMTTRFLERGDYIRLKNIQLGYSLPKNLMSGLHINTLRFYLGITNLLTITKYGGFDPEVGTMTTLPVPRTINFGFSLKL